jgi:hypothetical protein
MDVSLHPTYYVNCIIIHQEKKLCHNRVVKTGLYYIRPDSHSSIKHNSSNICRQNVHMP